MRQYLYISKNQQEHWSSQYVVSSVLFQFKHFKLWLRFFHWQSLLDHCTMGHDGTFMIHFYFCNFQDTTFTGILPAILCGCGLSLQLDFKRKIKFLGKEGVINPNTHLIIFRLGRIAYGSQLHPKHNSHQTSNVHQISQTTN